MGLMSSDANVMQRERFTRRWKRRFGPGSGRWKWMFVNWWNIQYPQWFSLMLQHEPPLGAAAPFDTKEQHLYSELPPGVWNAYPILNPEASQPMETLVSAPCTCTSHTLKHVYHRHNSTQLPIVKVVMEKQISMAQFDSARPRVEYPLGSIKVLLNSLPKLLPHTGLRFSGYQSWSPYGGCCYRRLLGQLSPKGFLPAYMNDSGLVCVNCDEPDPL